MRIYLDLDGVMWKMINGYHEFYANLPLMKDAIELFDKLWWDLECDITILTACPKSNYKDVVIQKRDWVRKHISTDITVIPMMGGTRRASRGYSFPVLAGDILIDDMEKNCKAWEKLGGKAIIHKNAKDTIAQLVKIMEA